MDIEPLLLAQLILCFSAILIFHVSTSDEVHADVPTMCSRDARDVCLHLGFPGLFCAEGECPPLLRRLLRLPFVPAISNFRGDGIRFRIDLAVAATGRTCLRHKIWADFFFGELAGK